MKLWLFTCILSAAAAAVAAAQGAAPRSAWDSVYTDAQAKRGEKVSTEQCARCHGQTLTGAEAAPAHPGESFAAAERRRHRVPAEGRNVSGR